MERVARVFQGFDEAESADEAYYAELSPDARLDVLLSLIEQYRSSIGEAAERFERVYRIAELAQS